jgi:hypothetical protein
MKQQEKASAIYVKVGDDISRGFWSFIRYFCLISTVHAKTKKGLLGKHYCKYSKLFEKFRGMLALLSVDDSLTNKYDNL